jgi:hypothetical protein
MNRELRRIKRLVEDRRLGVICRREERRDLVTTELRFQIPYKLTKCACRESRGQKSQYQEHGLATLDSMCLSTSFTR